MRVPRISNLQHMRLRACDQARLRESKLINVGSVAGCRSCCCRDDNGHFKPQQWYVSGDSMRDVERGSDR